MKSVKELKALGDDALKSRMAELRKELTRLMTQVAMGTVPKSPGLIRKARRSIARILTILNERRMSQKA